MNHRPPTSFPERVGRYELLLPIASGGMATVYLARVESGFDFEREVAVKLVHAHLRSEGFEHDLIEEAKLAGRIRHPNVVQTLDVGDDPAGVLYLVMDYVEGEALSGLMRALRDGPSVRTGVTLRVLVDALRGLHAAHELRDVEGRPVSLVHRDFSPQNVLVGVDGVGKLADFGIAKAATRLTHTATGVIKGKFGYMAPEQALAASLDRRVDIWAAGVIAWEITLRRRLHGAGNDAATLLRIVNEDAPRLRSIDPTVPQALDDALAAALARDPKRRTPTAEALADALERACAGTDWELADAKEVAEAVQRLAGGRLEERRNASIEMRRLRKTIGALAASAPVETSVSPFASIRPAAVSTTDVDVAREAPTAPDGPAARASRGESDTMESQPTWRMSSPADSVLGAGPAPLRRWLLAAGAGTIALLTVLGIFFGVLRSPVVPNAAQASVEPDHPQPGREQSAVATTAPEAHSQADAAPAATAAIATPAPVVSSTIADPSPPREQPSARAVRHTPSQRGIAVGPARPSSRPTTTVPAGRPLLGMPSQYGPPQ